MKFPVPKTLRGAMSPMILASWVFGMGIFECPADHPRPIISFCWSIANLLLFLTCLTFSIVTDPTDATISPTLPGIYRLIIYASITFVIIFLYLGYAKSKDVVASLSKLNAVNEILKKYEIPAEYGPTFNYQIIQLIGGFLFVSTLLLVNALGANSEYHSYMERFGYQAYTVDYLLMSTIIIEGIFCSCIRYIGNRFQYLNAYLVQSSCQDKNEQPFLQTLELDDSHRPTTLEIHTNPYSFRIANKHWTVHLIWNIRKIHLELCRIARTLNEAFGVQILMSMTVSFGLITALLHGFYNVSVVSTSTSKEYAISKLVFILFWLIFYIAKVFHIVYACSMTSTQARKMGELIHEFVKPTTDIEIKEEIYEFSLQILQNPLQFTACGFFTLDYEMICGMFGAVTTYLVIIIQLQSIYEPKSELTETTPHPINTTYENLTEQYIFLE